MDEEVADVLSDSESISSDESDGLPSDFEDEEIDSDEAGLEEDSEEEDESKYEDIMQALQDNREPREQEQKTVEEEYPENEYSVMPQTGASSSVPALSVSTLIQSLKGKAQISDELDKRLGRLTRVAKGTPLPRLAHKVDRDKMIREVSYGKVKDEVTGKWRSTILTNRKAEHLSFPFNEPKSDGISTASLATSLTPTTDLELGVAEILKRSGIEEKKIKEFEEFELNKLQEEEVEARMDQLKKMRYLMFYHEKKMKRKKKIKSKRYRKILKRQKMKNELSLEELEAIDEEAAKEKYLKLEKLRITERVTGRHRNKGKWAKSQLKRKNMDQETRRAIAEQLKQRKELLQKQGFLFDESDKRDDEDDVSYLDRKLLELDNEEAPQLPEKGLFSMEFMKRGIEKRKNLAEQQEKEYMKQLTGEQSSDSEDDPEYFTTVPRGKSKKNVDLQSLEQSQQLSMVGISGGQKTKVDTFVSVSMSANEGLNPNPKKDKFINIFEVEEFPDANDEININASDEKFEEKENVDNQKDKQKKNKAKIMMTTTSATEKTQPKEELAEGKQQPQPDQQSSSSEELSSSEEEGEEEGKEERKDKSESVDSEGEEDDSDGKVRSGSVDNPWMNVSANGTSNNNSFSNKRKLHLLKKDEANVKIDPQKVLKKGKSKKSKKKKRKTEKEGEQERGKKKEQEKEQESVKEKAKEYSSEEEEEEEDDIEDDDEILNQLEQRELIKQAFANDNVVKEFEEEKKAIIEAENESVPEEVSLPGWGQWVGKGAPEPKKKTVTVLQRPRKRQQKPKRKDANLKHVIINPKRDKKFAAHQMKQLPYPFQTEAQYESYTRNPIGPDWNTAEVYEQAIKPRIATKRGSIIEPIAAPLPTKRKRGQEREKKGRKRKR